MTALYYQDDHVTIYHGDWRDHPEWLTGDVLVTDPPYGYGHASEWGPRGPKRRHSSPTAWPDQIKGDNDTSIRDAALNAWSDRPALVFGSWKRPAPYSANAALVWDKGMASGMGDLSVPWKPNWELIYVIGSGFSGRRDSGVITGYHVISWVSGGRTHPNEKPVDLMRDLLLKCPVGTVADPFMGTGSTLRAAKDLGRRAIGVELEERYCEVAARRMAQEVLNFGGEAS